MDSGQLSLCGEESFGTGSDHIREKDGLWAVLAWLSVLEAKKSNIKDVMLSHWKQFGRNFFSRYDYEECESEGANQVMQHLKDTFAKADFIDKEFSYGDKTYKVSLADDFQYTDPIDHSLTTKQVNLIFGLNFKVYFETFFLL